ncbi:hypothetical protein B0H11DRAFT_2056714 [Mycena galericulata]|nr:hypothetical protein B0H11DRAFT_2056714 [Mycena galericulata]
MRDFAQELIDEILDRRADMVLGLPEWRGSSPSKGQVKEFGTLGLVCRQWRPRSRYHLFSYVKLRSETVQAFFHLVDTSSSPILPLIKILDLQFDRTSSRLLDDIQLLRFRESSELMTIWIRIFGESATESDMQPFYASLQSQASALGNAVPWVSWLNMTFTSLPLSAVVGVVSYFQALETVRLSGEEMTAGIIPAPHPLSLSIHTVELNIFREGGLDPFFAYLLSLPNLPILETVEVNVRQAAPDGAIALYFQKYGGTIRHLILEGVRPLDPGSVSVAQVALRYTTDLRTLYIIGEHVPILDCITAVTSQKLIRLRIYQLLFGVPLEPNPWGDIDAVLAEPRFRTLTFFQVYATHWHTPEQSDSLIQLGYTGLPEVRAAMPQAVARNILAFEPWK